MKLKSEICYMLLILQMMCIGAGLGLALSIEENGMIGGIFILFGIASLLTAILIKYSNKRFYNYFFR